MASKNRKPELNEKDFIQDNGLKKHPFRFVFWFLLVVFITLLALYGQRWISHQLRENYEDKPFQKVTNRQMSLFLWNNPSFMRANVKRKNGYLPAFNYIGKQNLEPQLADEYVQAPPELLFVYHTWDRLFHSDWIPRAIPSTEFKIFLEENEEWKPGYWKDAPENYSRWVKEKLPHIKNENLEKLPAAVLPIEIRQAFVGWKNYFLEGEEINFYQPTYGEIAKFLKKHPHYDSCYWKNIVNSGSVRYLDAFTKGKYEIDQKVPNTEISGFLKAALYNEKKEKS